MMSFTIIFLALLLANIPWVSNNLFIFIPQKKLKSTPLTLLEVLTFYLAFGIIVSYLEKQIVGNIHQQSWEFYVVTFFLFVVFSSPGFIYKVIWK